MKTRCPCCLADFEGKVALSRDKCPAINNVVYQTEEEARSCITGSIKLILCPVCGFVFNSAFDERLPRYDESYDNARAFSVTYRNYLDELVGILSSGISEASAILEIGCGQGEFLGKLCSATGARGFGYDAVYRGEANPSANLRFFKEYFDPSKSQMKYDIVILRHVLEHIAEPYRFLERICFENVLKPGGRLWIEVPDLEWILGKGAFYDITYEHCNYFSRQALQRMLALLGLKTLGLQSVFQGQYILAEASITSDKVMLENHEASALKFVEMLNHLVENKKKYENILGSSTEACVWGASAKGVIMLAELGVESLKKVKYVVDINPNKQWKYLPCSGKRVDSPDVLKQAEGELLVLIMNGIYESEIKAELAGIGVKARTMVV